MRFVSLLGTLFLVAACAGGIPSNPEAAHTASPRPLVSAFDTVFASRAEVRKLAQTKQFSFKGTTYNVSEPLHRMGGGQDARTGTSWKGAWVTYFGNLNDGRIRNGKNPRPVEAMSLLLNQGLGELAQFCLDGTYEKTVRSSYYCQEKDDGDLTPQTALMVVGEWLSPMLQEIGAVDPRAAWTAASIVAGSVYVQHLRHEMGYVGISWPEGELFDYCVVGISLRAVVPKDESMLVKQAAIAMAPRLDLLKRDPGYLAKLLERLIEGYKSGRLTDCPRQ